MKQFFTIKEISKLYNIGVDSIRYYEKKGLITPERGDNNYRYYGLHDIFKLNIIRDLLELNIPTDDIKTYLDALNVENSIALYTQERRRIDEEIQRLQTIGEALSTRARNLSFYKHLDIQGVYIKQYEKRYCYELESHIHSDDEADFVIKALHHKHQDKLGDLGDLEIGAIPVYADLEKGISDTFQSVFIIDHEAKADADFYFQEGTYLSIYYRGSYTQSTAYLEKIISIAQEKGYTSNGKPFEIYHIDNRFTADETEFVTEVQVFVA